MIVAGVMSGTSADGIDVALVRISGRGWNVRLKLLSHLHSRYPTAVRDAVLHVMNSPDASVAELSRLNFLLGELYADAVSQAQKRAGVDADLAGCHGQTIYHQGEARAFLGRKVACTWQTGEGAVMAARLAVPVVSDFRPADMAAGGKGAPLVPFLDYGLFRHRRIGRIVQNIGGIANLTAISAGAKPEGVLAFDTGPGNMLMDQLMQLLYSRPFDRSGLVARRGKILTEVLEECLRKPFFKQSPPKTAGREEFGREFAGQFLRDCKGAAKEDVIMTATALTARSIFRAISKFVLPRGKFSEYVVSGGGTLNRTLMQLLSQGAAELGMKLRHSDELAVPSQAKEAMAFALLAYQTWHRQPGNIPSATGAARPAILGKISYA